MSRQRAGSSEAVDVIERESVTRFAAPKAQAMVRERLSGRLLDVRTIRLALITGAAGSGKTTLLSEFTAKAGVPCAWYSVVSIDSDRATMLRHLQDAIAFSFGPLQVPLDDVTKIGPAIARMGIDHAVLVLDDLQCIAKSKGERLVEVLVAEACPPLTILAASRAVPDIDLSRLRVSGSLLEIGSDDLRFRSWEVERLFKEFYREPLAPEDLAELTRRTEGWAAGLQLFHLATVGKSPQQRRSLLLSLGANSPLVREYLARNALAGLPPRLRSFLVGTCVLERLTVPICDELLGHTGSGRLLEELARRQLFTYPLEEPGTYRYHEVLRDHLEMILIEQLGEAGARELHGRAADLLEMAGALPEALRAYCRAEHWEGAARLLGRDGERLIDGSTEWLDAIPTFLLDHDPWLHLAFARRYRAAGRLSDAVASYARAEPAFRTTAQRDVCLRERLALAAWLDPMAAAPDGWPGALRSAVVREPMAVRRRAIEIPGPLGQFVRGLSALLAGELHDARAVLKSLAESPDVSPALGLGARVAHGIVLLLLGNREGATWVEQAAEEAEVERLDWITRLCRAALALGNDPNRLSETLSVRLAFEREGDTWGEAISALLEGIGRLRAGDGARDAFECAIIAGRAMGAGVIEAWGRGGLALALARSGDPDAREAAVQAEAFARSVGVRAAQLLAFQALAEIDDGIGSEFHAHADDLRRECGLTLPQPPRAVRTSWTMSLFPIVEVRCFGGFRFAIEGRIVEMAQVRPRACRLLHLLAIHPDRPVHREVLLDALWRDIAPEAASRNLHVAVSSLRHSIEHRLPNGLGQIIRRQGDAYLLCLPPGSMADVREFDRLLDEAQEALAWGDESRRITALAGALDMYEGELLPEDGPAEWAVAERERRRWQACEAARSLAELHLLQRNYAGAVRACEQGLRIDPYQDDLWRLRVRASQEAGDTAAARQAQRRYESVLIELGVGVVTPPVS
jgi:DNA-binding SARP family transcriptional activator